MVIVDGDGSDEYLESRGGRVFVGGGGRCDDRCVSIKLVVGGEY